MTYSHPNRSGATGTRTRLGDDVNPQSGLCVVCQEDCAGYCEVAQSSLRGPELLYPQPYGHMTAAAQKSYPVDYSHLNIMGTAVGAHGVAADPDEAIFPNADISATLAGGDIELDFPAVVPGLGSTDVARRHWEGLAVGCAISGVMLTIGENVVGMDKEAVIENGEIKQAPELARRIALYQDWSRGKGQIVMQENVEDSRLGALEFAVRELGLETVELKWGQGAKDIGGEVKIDEFEKARLLKERGYLVLPDPRKEFVEKEFGRSFTEFERHSRIGMVTRDGFHERVGQLREAGAKRVFLKTGAYRPADLARAFKFASEAELDLLTIDGAGGGTGMSPWGMMNEWGVPTFYLQSLAYRYAKRLADAGKHVPALAMAGGFSLEDHVFKAIAMGAPYFKIVGLGRAPLTAAMIARNVGLLLDEGQLPKHVMRHGSQREQVFVYFDELQERYDDLGPLPDGAVGVYTYIQRLSQGLRQLMTGSRKFALDYLERGDLACLTREAADLSGIPFVTEVDAAEVDEILGV